MHHVSTQDRLHEWRMMNFPNAEADQQLMGVVEEVGELAHSNLKRKQEIRGTEQEHIEGEEDAVGDILIYLAGYCSYRGWNIFEIWHDTADEMMKRDWLKYPGDGLTR